MSDKTLSLDGKIYTVQALPAKRGARLFVKTMRLVGPGLIMAFDPAMQKESTGGEKFASAIALAFQAADDGPFDEVFAELLDTVEENGVSIKDRWNVQFSGKLWKLFQIAGFAIGAHFGDFQNGFAGLVKSANAEPTAGAQPKKQ